VIVRRGRATHGSLERALDRALAAVPELRAAGRGTLATGAEDPQLPGPDALRPLVVVPATGPRRVSPWAAALVSAADAVVLLDACETAELEEALTDRLLLVAGLPAPPPAPEGRGVAIGEATHRHLGAAWRERSAVRPDGPGVAWIGGRGAAPVAGALEAWAAGRGVVTLPGTPPHELLRRGGALRAESDLEVIEATAFLSANAPLARALGQRGRELAASQPSPREVGLRLLEGAELARATLTMAP
jgi:hypothetical protein